MKIAYIAPTKHLDEFSCYRGNDYHMILAQHIMGDLQYRDYYTKRGEQGDFLLLDNGAFEFGQSVAKDILLESALLTNPDLMVLPDKRGFAKETLEMSFDFLEHLVPRIPKKTRIMAVVQGSSPDEWLNCFKEFAKEPNIKVIGISSTHGFLPRESHYFSRAETIEYLAEHKLIPKGKSIHLCGLGNSGHMELDRLKGFDFIEGCDSSAPVVHGLHDKPILMEERYQKIAEPLDFEMDISEDKHSLIYKNLDLFHNIVYGS
jgi:hypothetical protein